MEEFPTYGGFSMIVDDSGYNNMCVPGYNNIYVFRNGIFVTSEVWHDYQPEYELRMVAYINKHRDMLMRTYQEKAIRFLINSCTY